MPTIVNSAIFLHKTQFMPLFQEKQILLSDTGMMNSPAPDSNGGSKKKKMDIDGELWNVLEATGQPISMKNP